MSERTRAVIDCNTYLQGLSSPRGPAARCLQFAFERQFDLFISPVIMAELREALARPSVIRKLKLRPERVDEYLAAIELVATMLDGFPRPFSYARDPDDAQYVNLALAANAKLIVSRDRDLLDLMDESKPDGHNFHIRFPELRILDPVAFLKDFKKA